MNQFRPHPANPALRVVFAGTPEFAVPSLKSLLHHGAVDVVAVYTQPDRPAGRGRKVGVSPVKSFAVSRALHVEQPLNWKTSEVVARFSSFLPDLLVVAAYGIILPEAGLRVPRLGAINVHASLLPRWRGAAPIQRAIMAGDRLTGITIMQVVTALDAGPMLLKRECAITETDTSGSLERKLAELGADALGAAIQAIVEDRLIPEAQVEAEVTYAPKITRADRALDWARPARDLERQIRALSPTPSAYTEILGLPLNILRAAVVNDDGPAPGTVVRHGPEGIDIATADGCLRLIEVQPPGKRAMPIRDFLNGYGQRLFGAA